MSLSNNDIQSKSIWKYRLGAWEELEPGMLIYILVERIFETVNLDEFSQEI